MSPFVALDTEEVKGDAKGEAAPKVDVKGVGDDATVNSPAADLASNVQTLAGLSITVAVIVLAVASGYRFLSMASGSAAEAGAKCTAGAVGGQAVGPQCGPPLLEAKEEGGVVALFQGHAQMRPHAPALLDADSGVATTYGQLAQLVLAVSSELQSAALGHGDVAGLLLEPSRSFVVATLGCMQANVCWLPLDVKSPSARLRQLLDRAGARLALATESFPSESLAPVPVWTLGAAGEVLRGGREAPPGPSLQGVARAKGAAAIFYTSGSTGEPKAVMYGPETICHGALSAARLCDADSESVFLVKTPVIWAVTEYESFTPLTVGARAVVDARAQRDPVRLARTISEHGVSILVTSAPVLQLLADERLPSLRHAINVGAALPLEVCAAVQRVFGAGLAIHNLYGCTETPCVQWTHDPAEPAGSGKLAPAGLPQPGVEVHVLDAELRPLPEGALGEIYFGGDFLSRGYLGDERLTQERFVPRPLGEGRLYRTGDTGRWLRGAGGRLALLVEGRVDRQLNIKGVRVAPEEIEAVLCQAPGVREVALAVVGERLIGCAAGEGEAKELEEALRSHATEHLPLHMRPAAMLVLSALPKLGNGKVDLPALARQAAEQAPPEEEDEVGTVDSLGQMKMVKRQALQENRAMSAMRAVAALDLVIYHWYWCHFTWCFKTVYPGSTWEWTAQGPDWFLAFVQGLHSTEWCMEVFILMSGYADSREASQSMLKQNLLALFLWIIARVPIPHIFNFVMHVVLQNPDQKTAYSFGQHRWYILYYLFCNCLHSFIFLPLRNALASKPRSIAAIAPAVVLACVAAATRALTPDNGEVFTHFPLNLCPVPLGTWQPYLEPLISLVADEVYMEKHSCPVTKPHLWLLLQYSLAWWWGPPLVELYRGSRWGRAISRLGPLPWLALFFGGLYLLGRSYEHLDGAWLSWVDFLDPIWAYILILGMALASQCAWFPLSALAWLGNYTLSVYIFHAYFVTLDTRGGSYGFAFFTYRQNTTLIPSPESAVHAVGNWPGSSLAKLAVLVTYALVWSATFGVVFQKLVLGCVSLGQMAATKLLAR